MGSESDTGSREKLGVRLLEKTGKQGACALDGQEGQEKEAS